MPHRSAGPVPAVRSIVAIAAACAALALGALGAGAAHAATLPTVNVTVSPTTIVVSGALQSGAVNIAGTATGGKEPQVTLFQVKPGVSVNEVYAYLDTNKLAGDPNTAAKYGSLAYDTEAGKGKPFEAQTILQPGQYIALNTEGEKPSKWARSSFTVTASPSPAALPPAQATEKTIDFGFRGPKVLHVGQLVRFENEGNVVHMDFAFAAKGKRGAKAVLKGLATGRERGLQRFSAGPPIGLAGPLSPGAFQQQVIIAKPGYYVQACFMPTQDGRPHTLIGMERIIRIVK